VQLSLDFAKILQDSQQAIQKLLVVRAYKTSLYVIHTE